MGSLRLRTNLECLASSVCTQLGMLTKHLVNFVSLRLVQAASKIRSAQSERTSSCGLCAKEGYLTLQKCSLNREGSGEVEIFLCGVVYVVTGVPIQMA